MAFREVTMTEVKEVLRLWLLGRSKKEIARQLGAARNTVRRIIAAGAAEGVVRDSGTAVVTDDQLAGVVARLETRVVRVRGESWATCLARRDFIGDKLAEGLRLTKVQRLLARHGAPVTYGTLRRFAKASFDFRQAPPTIPVADGEPGVEVQLDTGWMMHLEPDITGQRRRFRAFIFTPSCSRYRFAYPCLRETTADAIEACEAAWRFYGGVFEVVLVDNMKAIVNRADALGALLVTAFLEYAQARGFVVDTTRVRRPKDKAKVERSVQDVREDCFRGERLFTIPEAVARAETWAKDEIGMRRHSRTGRLPREHFTAVEQSRLLPAPSERYDIPEYSKPTVAPDQYVVVGKALYSMPRVLRRQQLDARADSTTVRLHHGATLVRVYPRQPPGGRYTHPDDFPPEVVACATRDVAFLQKKAASHGEHVGRFATEVLAGPQPWTRMRRLFALLGLCKRFGDRRVNEACARALSDAMHDVRRLTRMLERAVEADPQNKPVPGRVIPLPRFARDPKQFALRLVVSPQGQIQTQEKKDKEDDTQ